MVDAVMVINVGRRPGLVCDEFTAECGACGRQLWRKASFARSSVDYVTCTICQADNRIRKPVEAA